MLDDVACYLFAQDASHFPLYLAFAPTDRVFQDLGVSATNFEIVVTRVTLKSARSQKRSRIPVDEMRYL